MDIEFRPIKPRSVKKEDIITTEKVSAETINKINNRLIVLAEYEAVGSVLSEEKAKNMFIGE